MQTPVTSASATTASGSESPESSAVPGSSPSVGWAVTPFASVPVLRRTHTTLLRRQRGESGTTPPAVEEIVNFMERARATGRHIAATESRDAIQGLIDYWYGILMLGDRKGVGELGSLNLDEFAGNSAETPEADSASETQARTRAELDAKVQAFDAQLPAENRPLLRRLLLRLFTLSAASNRLEFTHLPTTDEFFSDLAAPKLAAAMLSSGLLETEATDLESHGAYILADPGLLKAWPLLAAVVEERLSLRDMTAGWEKSGRSSSALLGGGPLLDLAADYVNLKPAEAVFLSESRQAATQREKKREAETKKRQEQMRKKIWMLKGLIVCVFVLLLLAIKLMRDAQEYGERAAQAQTEAEISAANASLAAADAEAAREAEKKAFTSKAAAVEEEAHERERLLREQLDATNQSAAEMRTIVEDARKAIGSVEGLRRALITKLRSQELKRFDDTLGKLRTTLKQAETTAATADALDSAIGSATQIVQNVVKEPRPRLVKVLEGHRTPITAIAFAKAGDKLATAGEDKLVRLWTAKGASLTDPITGSGMEREGVSCLAFSPDKKGRWLAIGSRGSTVRLFDFTNRTSSPYQRHYNSITSVEFSADGSKVLSASADKTIHIWDPVTRETIQQFGPASSIITWAAFDPKATKVVGSLVGNAALIWTLGSNADPLPLPRRGAVTRAVFSPDGERIVTSSADKTVAVWMATVSSVGNPSLVWSETQSSSVLQAVFSPDGNQVACACSDGTANTLGAQTGKQLRKLQGHKKAVSHVAYHPGGRILLTGSADTTAKLWYEDEEEARYTLEGHTGDITVIAFSENGTQIATGSEDGTVRLYDFQEDTDQPPKTAAVTGWCLYGWLDTTSKGATPRLRAQSFAPVAGERDAIPIEGNEAVAEAIMNVRDEIERGTNNRWHQGKPIDLLRKGDRIQILEVLWDQEMSVHPHAVWVKFKKL